jgi:hypothetical protein
MFESKKLASTKDLEHYIGARVTSDEKKWLESEMEKRKLSMSDLIRHALGKLMPKDAKAKTPAADDSHSKS